MSKLAIVTGVTGQDGSYLTELLLEKGYTVNAIVRRTSYLIENSNVTETTLNSPNFHVYTADLLDQVSLVSAFEGATAAERVEVYNLAAQSDVGVSFRCPKSTSEINYIGTLNLLETVRQLDLIPKTRFYQASTSEMFGKVQEVPQKETTPFYPRSPYGVSKLAAHWLVKNYNESYGLFTCSGILFNHESPRRGIGFVTQKITKGVRDVLVGKLPHLEVGNLNSKRDWGHAKDYVRAMWLMLQQTSPDDYVVATGVQHSVRDFVESVLRCYGKRVVWEGEGVDEVGRDALTNQVYIRVSPKFYRPCEVDTLVGDASKIRATTGWTPLRTFDDLVRDMVGNDPAAVSKLYA